MTGYFDNLQRQRKLKTKKLWIRSVPLLHSLFVHKEIVIVHQLDPNEHCNE